MPVVNGIDLRSGINGSALFNAAEPLPVISWTFNPNAKDVEFENSKSGGFDIVATTFKRGSGTIVFDYDFLNPPTSAPLILFPGIVLTNVGLYVDKTIRAGWFCYQIVLLGQPTSVNVSGKIGTSFGFKTTGAYAVGS